MLRVAMLTLLLTPLCAAPLRADEAFPPHKIVGNVYYVGSKALASYLIATPEGHILINSGFEETVPLIRASAESLGFKLRDVKIVLASHAHSDHVAGHALLKELTGAKVYVMRGDEAVIASGGAGQYLYTDSRWRPCEVDRVLNDGDEVALGGLTLVARRTPGHTRGCTTWTWRVSEGGKNYSVVVIGSPNVNPGYRLVGNEKYPEIADDFAKTFQVLKSLPCDIFLGAHGDYYGMTAKHERLKGAAQNPFVDPEGYRAYADLKEQAFRKTLAEQQDVATAQEPKTKAKAKAAAPAVPEPTLSDVAYGTHPKQVLHFWKAESDWQTPVLFYIHGGGWQGGNRTSGLAAMLPEFLKQGISVVSVEYRFIPEAIADGVKPPVKAPLHDAARALQFVRSKASEWNIDKNRIAASGGSAGACSSLWLAFHEDLANPKSDDPVARESTRLLCAAVAGAQTTLDPQQMKEWTPNSRYGSHAFGIFKQVNGKDTMDFDAFLAQREAILPWIQEYSPYALVTADDPPIFLYYGAPPALGQDQKDPTHTANFGVKLQEKLKGVQVPCELVYPGAADVAHPSVQAYLIEKLKSSQAK